MSNRIIFTELEIKKIVYQYTILNLSCEKIGKLSNMSKVPINKLLKGMNLLRKGNSDGKKINLTKKQKEKIKRLYLVENKTSPYISKELNLNLHFIEKYIYNSDFKRTQGESITLRQTGKKRSDSVKNILKLAQQKFAKSGMRKQTGGICKSFMIEDLSCDGTYEKFYIEKLISENKELPKKCESVNTPFGVYYPDFDYKKTYIEIKSDYTYEILLGKKKNRWSNKIDTNQFEKIKWVNSNVKPVQILVVDKRNNKLIKKEIV